MKKGWNILFILVLISGLYYIFFTQIQHKVPVKNKAQEKAQAVQASASVKKVKTTLAVDDPLLSCSNDQDVCEKAVLPPKQLFSYSNYIWANAGEPLTFGVTTPGETIGIWIESEDGTFSSDEHIIQPKGNETFSVDAPFDGNFRVVVEAKNTQQSKTISAYIKDPWN